MVSEDDERAFGRYRLFAKLGSGGQADVFLAIARGTLGVDKLVVIKRARPGLSDDAAGLGDFLEEARLTLRLNHPNLVHTYEVGEEHGTHFISMEHIEGLSLRELFDAPRARELPASIWLRVIADALSGLAHAHGLRDYDGKPLGIVHRDISPHNILVSYDGVTKVLDFGIAKATPSGEATEIGGLTGKAAYMAPEQALGTADRKSDLFSMGVVLWEMLSGKRMFDGDAATLLVKRAAAPIPRLAEVMPEVDPELDELVARALESDPALRYASANEMRQTIERYLRKTGQVVREMEVGEAIAAAFAAERAQLQARIQQAMAGEGSGPVRGELPGLRGVPGGRSQLGGARRAMSQQLPVVAGAAASSSAAGGAMTGAGAAEGAEGRSGSADDTVVARPRGGRSSGAMAAVATAAALSSPSVAVSEAEAGSGFSGSGAGSSARSGSSGSATGAGSSAASPSASGSTSLSSSFAAWMSTGTGRTVAVAGAIGLVLLLGWRATRETGEVDAGRPAHPERPERPDDARLASNTTGAGLLGRGAPAAPAAGAAKPPACTPPLRVRVMYDMTGDTKEVGTAAGKGAFDYLRAINDAGGVRGCPVDIDLQDTQYDKRVALEVYEAWRAKPEWPEVSTVFVQGTPMTQVLGTLAADDQKVMISSAFAGEFAVPVPSSTDVAVPSLSGAFSEASVLVRKQSPGYPFVFFQGTDYTTAARVAATFAWRQGARRMAFFYCSRSAFCTEPVDGAKTFLKALGGTEIGRDLFIELDDDAATIERKVLAFFQKEKAHKAAEPSYEIADWIWFGNTSTNTAALGKALAKARAQLGLQIQLIGNNWSVDESLYGQCGEPCVGFYVVQPFALFGDLTASGTARMLADFARYRQVDGEAKDAHRMVQYVYGRVAVATWKIAVERVIDRGLPVTGPNLRAVLEDMRNVDVEGFATIGYSPADHRPQSSARVARVDRRGQLEPIGQPLSLSLQAGWLGW